MNLADFFVDRERTFRKKLREWKFKRVSATNNRGTDTGPANNNRFASALSTDTVEIDHVGLDDTLMSYNDMGFFNDGMNYSPHAKDFNKAATCLGKKFSPPPRDEIFEKTLQKLHEASSDCPSKDILTPGDFKNKGYSTLLHYVAARGRMSDALTDILVFCSRHGFCANKVDSTGYTALQIAVYYDRGENIEPLCAAGGRLDMHNPLGELPIHVAIMMSKNPQVLEKLFARHGGAARAPVITPSPRAGQVALDLAVERVLLDLSTSGTQDCTQATKSILLQVLKRGETLENTTYLRMHAGKDHDLFKRAIVVVGNVWIGGKLREIMLDVLSDVMQETVPFPHCDMDMISMYSGLL